MTILWPAGRIVLLLCNFLQYQEFQWNFDYDIYKLFGYFKINLCFYDVTICLQALSFLNVELLVIPSVKELREIWIRSFGFEPLDLRSKKMMKGMNLLVFRGTEMLQKKIPKRNFPDENLKSYSRQTSKRNLDSFLFN